VRGGSPQRYQCFMKISNPSSARHLTSQQRWGMVLRDSITPSMDPWKVVMMHAGRGRYPVCKGLGLVSIASLEQWQIWTIVDHLAYGPWRRSILCVAYAIQGNVAVNNRSTSIAGNAASMTHNMSPGSDQAVRCQTMV